MDNKFEDNGYELTGSIKDLSISELTDLLTDLVINHENRKLRPKELTEKLKSIKVNEEVKGGRKKI